MSRIAIVGTGIAGLTAAHHLHRAGHELTLFEAGAYVGGHTATKDVVWQGQSYAIDTGFIVFNDWTYPNFIALLDSLGVASHDSNMSFSLSCERTGLEYNGTSVNTLFAQRRNIVNPRFLRMIADILRFNTDAKQALPALDDRMTLAEFLQQRGYSARFVEHYIVPMGRAIWSASDSAMLGFPARFFIDFFQRHGFLNIDNRPVWRVVDGGSREYVRKLIQPFASAIRLNSAVVNIKRMAYEVQIRTHDGDVSIHDQVVLACHSDQALAMLDQPDELEREVLAAFPYQRNDVTLHTDTRMLPRAPLARAAWNYHLLAREQAGVALTYDINVLQGITAPVRFLVTLNRDADIDPATVLGRYVYHHPVYTPQAVAAQQRHGELNGHNRCFYCGAYWRYGFHEDGVVSALNMLKDLDASITGAQVAA